MPSKKGTQILRAIQAEARKLRAANPKLSQAQAVSMAAAKLRKK